MTTEDSGTLPPVQPSDSDPVLSAGLEIAMKWGTALGGPDKLDVSLRALEPELRRKHKEEMFRLKMKQTGDALAAQERREERAHRRHIAGVAVGGLVAIAMLGAGVYVAAEA